MKFFGVNLIVLLLIFHTEGSAIAQSIRDTLQLQSIQIIGKKNTRNFNESRSEIDSITLAKSSTIRLSELLSQNTSIFIKEYGRGAMATASFRGTAPSHTKISWNGLELNSPMLGMVDFSLIPIYFTDGVTLLYGSSSLSESAGALGGTIQLENNANWNNTLSGKLLSGLGSYHTLDEYIQISVGNRKIQSKSSLFYNYSTNDFQFLNKMNASLDPLNGSYIYQVEKNRNADYRNFGLLQEFYLQLLRNQTFTLKTWLQHNERSIPQLLTNESDEAANINRQAENALRSVAEWRRFGTRSKMSWKSAINVQNTGYTLQNRVSGTSSQVVIDAEARIFSFINKMDYFVKINQIFSLVGGIDVAIHTVDSENRSPFAQITGYNKTRTENSVFAELESRLTSNLSTVILIRESFVEFRHHSLLPLFRITYQPNQERQLIFTGSVAGNNHLPTLNDLYYIPGGNPFLKSEKGTQLDLNVSDEFVLGNQKLKTGISFFSSHIKDWIIWLPTFQGYWEPKNIDKVISSGIDANVSWSGIYKVIRYELKGNYAFTQTVNQSDNSISMGKQLPYIPKNSANLNLHLSYSNLFFDWMWNYYSKRYTTTANSEETISDYLYPYFMNNLQLGIKFMVGTQKLTVESKILNLFDEEYRTVLQRPMPGRNFQLVLRYDF